MTFIDEVIENTRQKAIALIQQRIDSASDTTRSVDDLAEYIVTEDFLRRFRELFNDSH